MDTDGYAGDCHTEYSTSLKSLADGMVELVQSLGGVARTRTRIPSYTYKGVKLKGKLSYRINVKLPSTMTPFRLQRKVDSYVRPTKYEPMRYIESIKYSHDEEAQCIAVDAPDHLYVTDEFIVTHNTIQAMATLQYTHTDENPSYPAVVVCPSSLVLNWKIEYNRFFPELIVETVVNRKTIPMAGTYDVLIIGYPNINAWEKQLTNHNSYVFDESHYCKGADTQRTKSAKKITRSNKDAIVLCLTGTPVTNKPAEYAPQLDILGQLDKFGGLWGFYRRYCDAHKDKWGQWHLEGYSNLEELNEKLRSLCYIRRTKDQVMTELPPVVHSPLVVDGADANMKEYAKAEADIIVYLVERAKVIAKELGLPVGAAAVSARLKAEAGEHLVRMSVLRKIAAKAKMPVVHECIQSRIEEGRKVVVAAHHREIVDELANKYGGLKIQGGMTVEDVEDVKHRFQTLSCADAPVIVLSIQAAKTGHTLTASQEVLFVELPWTPSDVDQTYSRCHRIGQKGSVTSTYMMTAGTIDEKIYALIDKKRRILNVAVEGEVVFDGPDAADMIWQLVQDSLGK
jgi:SNF2 family DNA or RNA helicase